MTEVPVFKPVETTFIGKREIYWGPAPVPISTKDAKGKKIVLNGRIRTIRHLDKFTRKAEAGDYVGISVFNDGELHD